MNLFRKNKEEIDLAEEFPEEFGEEQVYTLENRYDAILPIVRDLGADDFKKLLNAVQMGYESLAVLKDVKGKK